VCERAPRQLVLVQQQTREAKRVAVN